MDRKTRSPEFLFEGRDRQIRYDGRLCDSEVPASRRQVPNIPEILGVICGNEQRAARFQRAPDAVEKIVVQQTPCDDVAFWATDPETAGRSFQPIRWGARA